MTLNSVVYIFTTDGRFEKDSPGNMKTSNLFYYGHHLWMSHERGKPILKRCFLFGGAAMANLRDVSSLS